MNSGRIIELLDGKKRYYELKVFSYSDFLDIIQHFKGYSSISIDYKSIRSYFRVRYIIPIVHQNHYSLVLKRGYTEFSWESKEDLVYQLRMTRIVYLIRISAFSYSLAEALLSFCIKRDPIYRIVIDYSRFMNLVRDTDFGLYNTLSQYVI